MFGLLSKLMGAGVPEEILRSEKLLIVDVRSAGEYNSGHIPGSINIPLNAIEHNLKKLKGDGPIVLCCASGNRSGMATSLLKSKGFKEVYNGGGWSSLLRQLEKLG
ncbi:MAG: hypothetical protein Fur0041_18880 [Bacteroidia bacterium]